MYKIVLKNVGKDMVNKSFMANTSLRKRALEKAAAMIREILGEDKSLYFSAVGDEVTVKILGDCVGSFTITKLN